MGESRGRGSVVEHNLAKVGVAGSNPVVRSIRCRQTSTLPGCSMRGVLRSGECRPRHLGGGGALGSQPAEGSICSEIARPEKP